MNIYSKKGIKMNTQALTLDYQEVETPATMITFMANTNSKANVTFIENKDTALVHELLLRIGVPAHLYGYEFIIYALEQSLHNPNVLHHVTKGLYLDIARNFQTNPCSVEHAIRHAISVACKYGDTEFINQMFKNSIRPNKSVPTNTMFLARLHYYINNREYEKLN